ncbi:MAG: glycosyltransferase family 4 protein, partial [Gammaproteobacteria bacterium]
MKIIFVTRSIIPSRTADSIQSMLMCEAFARLGHDVVLLTRAVNGDTAVAPDRLHSFYGVDDCFEIVKIKAEGRKLSGLLRFLRRSAVFIRKSQPDLVYSRDLWSCYLPSLLGITTFYEVHRQLEKSRRSVSFCLAVLMKLKGFKQIITVSEALKKLFAERYRVEKSRIKTLPNGARRNRGSAAAPVALGGNGRLQAGYAGNLFAGKGMETIAAIAPAAPEVDFHVIGGEQSDIDYWRARIDSPNLHFHGFVEHGRVPDYLAALDVCLLPNRKSVMTGSSGNEGSVDIGEYT